MNTKRIYDAQLNVSKFYDDNTINDLISKLSFIGDETYYNEKTKTIDIKVNRLASVEDDSTIRTIIKEWVELLPADEEDIKIITDNINYIFNIVKLGYPNLDKHIIEIYLH